jgi:uncharacterized integral membrane protein
MRRQDDLGPDDRDRDAEGRLPPAPPTPPRAGVSGRQVLIALLAIALIAFAIANFERVEVNFLVFQSDARVITVIAVAGVLGFVIGYFVGRPTREERKWLRRREES